MNPDIWKVLGIISIPLLIIYWRVKGAVWGGLTIGLFIGFIVAIFLYFQGTGFSWYIIGKGAILGIMVGFIAELLPKIAKRILK